MTDPFNMEKKGQDLVKEYFERNERKKEDEAWMKRNKEKVVKLLGDKKAMDFGNIRVSVVVPDTSKFNPDKLQEYFQNKKPEYFDGVAKKVVDEKKVEKLVESEQIDIDELMEYAWVESKGSPRVTVKLND